MNSLPKDPTSQANRDADLSTGVGNGQALAHEAADRLSTLRNDASQALNKAKDNAAQIARDLKERATHMAGDVSERASQIASKVKDETSIIVHDADEWTKNHRLTSALATLGIGAAIGAFLYAALKPEPTPRQHAREILKGLRASLAELGEPVSERASHFADDSRKAYHRGVDAVSDTRSRFIDQLKSLFG